MTLSIPQFTKNCSVLVTLARWQKPSQVRTMMRAIRAMTPAERIALQRDPLIASFFGPAHPNT